MLTSYVVFDCRLPVPWQSGAVVWRRSHQGLRMWPEILVGGTWERFLLLFFCFDFCVCVVSRLRAV